MVDGDKNLLSVIDWENAGTVPWGAVDFPLFLDVILPPMELPTNYDAEGNPVDEETRTLRKERNDYVQSLRDFKKERGSDNSDFGLAIYSEYCGFYCKLLDEFWLYSTVNEN